MKRSLLFASLFFLSACNESEIRRAINLQPDTSASTTESLVKTAAIRPAYATIRIGDSLQLTADIWFQDGTIANDVTDAVTTPADAIPLEWSVEQSAVASISAGQVIALSEGMTQVVLIVDGREAEARIVVEPALIPPINPNGVSATEDTDPTSPRPDDQIHETPPPSANAPFADRVVSYTIGSGGGFNEDKLPGIVLGPPHGAGAFSGSFDVFSLGLGGEIVLEFTDYIAFDGDGPDLIIFENAFQIGTNPDNTFAEPGIVGVSNDGINFEDFPCQLVKPYADCAGVHPTLADSAASATDPTEAGGDAFDLAIVGLQTARFVRIRDSGLGLGPIGALTRGFDLDAVAIVHGTTP